MPPLGVTAEGTLAAAASLAAIIGLLLAFLKERRELAEAREKAQLRFWEVFDLTKPDDAQDFYEALSKSIKDATQQIYRSGRGFAEISSEQERQIRELIHAEGEALRRGVRIARIQTSPRTTPAWAEPYSSLMREQPNLRVWADYGDPPLVNVAVVDPSGDHPVVQLLFESHEFSIDQEKFKAATAIFLYGKGAIATSIQRQFAARLQTLDELSADDVLALGQGYHYFAYGSNLSSTQMRTRCPQAIEVGPAVLYGWKLGFNVNAPHLGGSTAGISPSSNPDDHVWGFVYELSRDEKLALDEAERGGYVPVAIEVKPSGSRENQAAFTYEPVAPTSASAPPSQQYVEAMRTGAEEHGLSEVVQYLDQLMA